MIFECRHVVKKRLTPNAAIDQIATMYKGCDIQLLCKAATQVAVLGAAPRSDAWKSSGMNSWTRFAQRVLRMRREDCLPPTTDGLVAWSMAFKSRGTYDNYCGGVKSACLMWGLDVTAFNSELLGRAKMAIAKRSRKDPGSPGITFDILTLLVDCALDEQDSKSAALYVVAYWYLLRVPSEGLPARLGVVGLDSRQRSDKEIVIEKDRATVFFSRRKNREYPTKSVRPHSCAGGKTLCPVCTLESMVDIEGVADDGSLFPGISAKFFNSELRRRLSIKKVIGAQTFTSKGFRRGHAQDISRKYGVSPELFGSGDWTSYGGLFSYASREELEDLFVTNARKKKKKCRGESETSSSSSSSED